MNDLWTLHGSQYDRVEREVQRRRRYDATFKNTRGLDERATKEQIADWEFHAVAAEFVVSLATGFRWSGEGGGPRDARCDVGDNVEVKWSESSGIILKETRGPRTIGPHVLVAGRNPYHIVGWYPVTVEDYERPKDMTMPYPARVIPRSELRPFVAKNHPEK